MLSSLAAMITDRFLGDLCNVLLLTLPLSFTTQNSISTSFGLTTLFTLPIFQLSILLPTFSENRNSTTSSTDTGSVLFHLGGRGIRWCNLSRNIVYQVSKISRFFLTSLSESDPAVILTQSVRDLWLFLPRISLLGVIRSHTGSSIWDLVVLAIGRSLISFEIFAKREHCSEYILVFCVCEPHVFLEWKDW